MTAITARWSRTSTCMFLGRRSRAAGAVRLGAGGRRARGDAVPDRGAQGEGAARRGRGDGERVVTRARGPGAVGLVWLASAELDH